MGTVWGLDRESVGFWCSAIVFCKAHIYYGLHPQSTGLELLTHCGNEGFVGTEPLVHLLEFCPLTDWITVAAVLGEIGTFNLKLR